MKHSRIMGMKYIWAMCVGALVMIASIIAAIVGLTDKSLNPPAVMTPGAAMFLISCGTAIMGLLIFALGLFYYLKYGQHDKKPKIPISLVLTTCVIIVAVVWLIVII